jgi:MFS family permease
VTKSPILTVLRTYPREVALTAGAYIGVNMTYYIMVAFIISYGTNPQILGLSKNTMLATVLIGSTVQVIGLPLAGLLTDRINRRSVYMVGAIGLALFSFAFWPLVNTGSPVLITLAIIIGLGVLHSLMYGAQPTFFAETFSTDVRYSGVSLGIQVGSLLGGAFAPMAATALLARYGSMSIAWYMSICCVITLFSVWRIKETRGAERTAAVRTAVA